VGQVEVGPWARLRCGPWAGLRCCCSLASWFRTCVLRLGHHTAGVCIVPVLCSFELCCQYTSTDCLTGCNYAVFGAWALSRWRYRGTKLFVFVCMNRKSGWRHVQARAPPSATHAPMWTHIYRHGPILVIADIHGTDWLLSCELHQQRQLSVQKLSVPVTLASYSCVTLLVAYAQALLCSPCLEHG
jgi:hypothetical protein